MGIKVANNAFGTLAASITDSETSITLTTGQGARFPSLGAGDYFYATLIDTSNNLEIVKCTARSTDVLTVTRAQESTTARAYSAGDRIEIRITAATFEDATTVTPTDVSDQDNTSTGFFTLPAGTTAQRPGTAYEGSTRLNTDTGSLEVYDGANWNAVTRPFITSVTGTIYAGAASNLVVTGQNFTGTITVRFLEGGSTVADVNSVSVSAGSATVAVPAAVYGQTAGDSIEVKVLNSDGTISSNGVTKTVQGLPTGGTITTSGSYRIHTFTASSNLVVPSGFSATAEYLVVAGGGGGGGGANATWHGAGGGGAGGLLTGSTSISANTYAITVGSGGGGGAGGNNPGSNGSQGGTSSFAAIASCVGGGYGKGALLTNAGGNGGSGGGGAYSTDYNPGSGTAGQGNAGGALGNTSGVGGSPYGGGGGGAGSVGQINYVTGSSNSLGFSPAGGGNGGSGASSSISGSAVVYAQGGGGGGASDGSNYGRGGYGGNTLTPTSGGNGGGFDATSGSSRGTINGGNGTVNTGGGGGGGFGGTPQGNGGNGGSGIVIVRYQL